MDPGSERPLRMRSRAAVGVTVLVLTALIPLTVKGGQADCRCGSQYGGPAGACGSVRDFVTGEPIAGASVSFGTAEPAVSGEDGCYRASGTFSPPCDLASTIDCPFDVLASAPGYESRAAHGYRNYFPVGLDFRLASLASVACHGDCDGNRDVFVEELVCAVLEAIRPGGGCDCADANEDGRVTIDEVLGSVGNALRGCADCPTLDLGYCSTFF